jgi:adenylate kinase
MDEAVLAKPSSRFRGYVLSGFPTTKDEAVEFFLEDAPPPEVPPDAEGEEPSRPPSDERPPEKIFKRSLRPDAVVVLSSSDEACQQRNQESERPLTDPDFQKRMAKWKQENPEEGPKLPDVFAERGLEPLTLEVDEASETDLVEQVMTHLENQRPIYNFRIPPVKRGAGHNDQLAADAVSGVDEGAAQKEAEARRKKKEEEDRLEAIKKEEFTRLEKHSEPLRQYLMTFVVPTLTTGLIDVCRETPEDPIAYLAEYLSSYSTQLANSRRRKRQGSISPAPPA